MVRGLDGQLHLNTRTEGDYPLAIPSILELFMRELLTGLKNSPGILPYYGAGRSTSEASGTGQKFTQTGLRNGGL